jgi:hypothetical protein
MEHERAASRPAVVSVQRTDSDKEELRRKMAEAAAKRLQAKDG